MELKDVIGIEASDKNRAGDYEGHCVNSDYTYILPAGKVCFLKNDFRWTAIVEKIDIDNKKVYVSQINWLFMRHIIKYLYSDVKIEKRYPGRLTLATLRDSLQEISKEDIKKLSQFIGEKIVIKKSKEEIKMPIMPIMNITGAETVSVPGAKGLPLDTKESDEEEKIKKLINYFANLENGRIVKNKFQFILIQTANSAFVRVSDVSYQNTYFEKTYTNYTEKMQVLREAGGIFLRLISQGKPL